MADEEKGGASNRNRGGYTGEDTNREALKNIHILLAKIANALLLAMVALLSWTLFTVHNLSVDSGRISEQIRRCHEVSSTCELGIDRNSKRIDILFSYLGINGSRKSGSYDNGN